MRPRAHTLILVSLTLLACVAVVVACGGGGGESLEAYFEELDALEGDLTTQVDAAQQEFPDAFQESIATRDYMAEVSSLLEDAVGSLRAIDAPEQVETAHGEFTDAVALTQKLWEDFADELGESPSPDDVAELSERYGPQFDAVSVDFQDACLALEGIAADNGIDVDLDCEGQ